MDYNGCMFVGRQKELALLRQLKQKHAASLFVCKGRRRIGKSRLVSEFAKEGFRFLEFQGLSPRDGQSNVSQLQNFVDQLVKQSALPQLTVGDWGQALC